MNNQSPILENLAKFISFHSHPHASFYNTLEGILTDRDIKKELEKISNLLKLNYVFISYNKDTSFSVFLEKLKESLELGKTVFILSDTNKFHSVIYDQFINFREENKFNLKPSDSNLKDSTKTEISPNSHIFLILKQNNNNPAEKEIYEFTDHLLDTRGQN